MQDRGKEENRSCVLVKTVEDKGREVSKIQNGKSCKENMQLCVF